MLEIGWLSARLFFKGKLIREPGDFLKQIIIGTTVGATLLILLFQIQLPLWLGIILSSLITGAIMPFLLKDFKMK
ncbi:hypothetical protein [Nodularia chucula]|uniref:hypothetical protein n=1 Tax=Nodularia chucula TaxID=3093667 RepID=UPI0039C6491D